MLTSDRGSGTIVGAGILMIFAVLVITGLSVLAVLPVKHQVQRAADAAALATADVAAGRLPGQPCEIAAELARLAAATLLSCTISDEHGWGQHGVAHDTTGRLEFAEDRAAQPRPDVRVTLSTTVGGLTIIAKSRAGPPR